MDDRKYLEEIKDIRRKIDAVESRLYAARRASRSGMPETQGCVSNAIDDLDNLSNLLKGKCDSMEKSIEKESSGVRIYAYTKSRHRFLIEGKDLRTAIRNAMGKVEGGGAALIGKYDKGAVLVPYSKI